MPPIRVFSDTPIHGNTAPSASNDASSDPPTASKANGITPQTATAPTQTVPQPSSASRYTPTNANGPPPPQPGARPQPPFVPTPTSRLDDLTTIPDPPAPQPGAHPQSVTKTVSETVTTTAPPPPQLSYEPVSWNQAPSHSTSTFPPQQQERRASSQAGPTTINFGAVDQRQEFQRQRTHSLEHPPGYMQNAYAADGTAAQRAALQDPAAREREEKGVVGVMGDAVSMVGESLRKGEKAVWDWVGGKS